MTAPGGSAKVTFDRNLLRLRLNDAARRAAEYTVHLYQRELRAELSKKGSGRAYKGGNKGKGMKRTRSAPGEPPAVDTGELRRSVLTKPVYTNTAAGAGRVIRFVVGGVKPYGFMLDAGTKRVKARPWIQSPRQRVAEKTAEIFDRFITQALKKFARAT